MTISGREPFVFGAARRSAQFPALLAAALIGATSGALPAQTCQAPIAIVENSSYHDTTCGQQRVAESLCFGVPNPGPNVVFSFTLSGAYTGSLTLQRDADGFDPVMYLLDGTQPCDSGACLETGTPETPIVLDQLASGTYWLIIGASPASARDACGGFTLVNEFALLDIIFADGFDP